MGEFGYTLVCSGGGENCNYRLAYLLSGLSAILGSALWHLFMLIPALDRQRVFVRWHGRQILLLAGIRTAVPAASLVMTLNNESGLLWSIPVLIVIWLFGTLWGQGQASRGDCALMRWFGHGEGLPLLKGATIPGAGPATYPLGQDTPEHRAAFSQASSLHAEGKSGDSLRLLCRLLVSQASPELKAQSAEMLRHIGETGEDLSANVLVAILRFSLDPQQKRTALAGLEDLGLVEKM
jgi:hypothetical protein